MAKIKRKASKRKTKTRRNSCLPCMGALNPSHRGIRRINPDQELYQDVLTYIDTIKERLHYFEDSFSDNTLITIRKKLFEIEQILP